LNIDIFLIKTRRGHQITVKARFFDFKNNNLSKYYFLKQNTHLNAQY
jgi:hypothetical protein